MRKQKAPCSVEVYVNLQNENAVSNQRGRECQREQRWHKHCRPKTKLPLAVSNARKCLPYLSGAKYIMSVTLRFDSRRSAGEADLHRLYKTRKVGHEFPSCSTCRSKFAFPQLGQL